MRCVYLLDMNLSVTSLENNFSNSIGYLILLSMAFFAVQKVLNLIKSHLFIFAFVTFTLEDRTSKISPLLVSESVLPVFSCWGFMVSSLILRPIIYFEFISAYAMRKYSNHLILSHVVVQFSQQHFFKRPS